MSSGQNDRILKIATHEQAIDYLCSFATSAKKAFDIPIDQCRVSKQALNWFIAITGFVLANAEDLITPFGVVVPDEIRGWVVLAMLLPWGAVVFFALGAHLYLQKAAGLIAVAAFAKHCEIDKEIQNIKGGLMIDDARANELFDISSAKGYREGLLAQLKGKSFHRLATILLMIAFLVSIALAIIVPWWPTIIHWIRGE